MDEANAEPTLKTRIDASVAAGKMAVGRNRAIQAEIQIHLKKESAFQP
jgi:hypothetical protein